MKEIEVKVVGPLVMFRKINQLETESFIAIALNESGGRRGCIIDTEPFRAAVIQTVIDRVSEAEQTKPVAVNMTEEIVDVVDDLAKRTGARIERVVITGLENNTYKAVVRFDLNGSGIKIDVRSTSAIVIALRSRCGIFVNENLMREDEFIDMSKPEIPEISLPLQRLESDENLGRWLELADSDKIPKE